LNIPGSAMGHHSVEHTLRLAETAPAGCFVEVGVWRGGAAYHFAKMARERGEQIHLFDTFTGIPHELPDDSNRVGDFSDTSAEAVRALIPDAVMHVGVFPDTMPKDMPPIAFIHCDCDQYNSVRAVIEHLWPLVVPGGIMVMDDMDTSGGRRAIRETFAADLQFAEDRYFVRKA
jgi:O-methyltransferase